MIYLLAYQLANGKRALAISPEKTLVGSESSLEEAKKLLPDWKRYHSTSGTWSTTATLYKMSFHPCIVTFNSIKDVEKTLIDQGNGEFIINNESFAWGRARYTIINDDAEFNIAFV